MYWVCVWYTFDPGFGAQQWRLFRAETLDAVFQAVNGTFFGVKVVLISNWSPNAKIIDGILRTQYQDVRWRVCFDHL
jgi:hypothetical protein